VEGLREVTRPARDHVRVVCISDIHETQNYLTVPPGDLLVIAGDILLKDECSLDDSLVRLRAFNEWLGKLPHQQKVVIGGNHDFTISQLGRVATRQILSNAIYLEDEAKVVCGLRIYGSPVSYGTSDNTAFQVPKDKALEHLDIMPHEVDILVVHGISEKMQDAISEKFHPRFIVCGHWHDKYGFSFGEKTTFINACTVDEIWYLPCNPPVVFDVLHR